MARRLQNLPFYRIFVADSRCPRDGRHLEQVGHYDPVPGEEVPAGSAGSVVQGPHRLPACSKSATLGFSLSGAGKDGNKHIGLNIERIR